MDVIVLRRWVWSSQTRKLYSCIGMYASSSVPASSTLTTSPPALPKITFQAIATSFSEEANRQRSQLKMAKPGSEYANVISGSPSTGELRTNPANGIRIHKYNPKGITCDNPVCTGLPCSLTHDREHCLQLGGGAEGTKSSWGRKTSKAKKDVAASAMESKPDTTSSVPADLNTRRELACATIAEISSDDLTMSADNLACIARQHLSTILDSGATSTLITDRNVFWTYSEKAKVTVKTANHGTLATSGRGDCMAELSINGRISRVCLTHCLHAPSAVVNLLSVGHMLQKGWECNFKPNPACCELSNCEVTSRREKRCAKTSHCSRADRASASIFWTTGESLRPMMALACVSSLVHSFMFFRSSSVGLPARAATGKVLANSAKSFGSVPTLQWFHDPSPARASLTDLRQLNSLFRG